MEDKKVIVDEYIQGEKVVQFKTKDGKPFKMLLRSPDYARARYIESILYKELETQDEIDWARHLHVSRVIRSVIKNVEGLYIKNPTNGSVKEFKVEFTDATENELTINTYGFILKVFEEVCSVEEIEKFFLAYADLTQLKAPWVDEVKKKTIKA